MTHSVPGTISAGQGYEETLGRPAARSLAGSAFLSAARGAKPEHLPTPVWFMRQAGRSLPEYRQARQGTSMLEACLTPELTCEITLQPVRRHGVDAAILFSDIVLPLYAAGVDLDIVAGTGPVIEQPVRSASDVAALPRVQAEHIAPVAEAVTLLVQELGATPLIGFAGAPFTVASYLVEGGPSRDHARTKALMYSEPETWHALLDSLVESTLTFLGAQITAGADAVQLFDSWAGTLSQADYREYVLPHSRRILSELSRTAPHVPRIHFGVGTGELLTSIREAEADVVGVDWRTPLDQATRQLSAAQPEASAPVLQGNLDPAVLFADWPVIEREVRRVLQQGRAAGGHIFNLGHGVLPETDPGVITRVVELVHAETATQASSS